MEPNGTLFKSTNPPYSLDNFMDDTTPRPIIILKTVSSLIPNRVWTDIEKLRAKKRNRNPKWCFLPRKDCDELLLKKYGTNQKLINTIYPLSAWRMTQGIYRMDTHLLRELTKNPFSGDIPVEVLVHLPEWCVYVQLPYPAKIGQASIIGFFAMMSLTHSGAEDPTLTIVWDSGNRRSLDIDAIELKGTIEQSVENFIRKTPFVLRRGTGLQLSPLTQADRNDLVSRFNLVIPILLYLASVGKYWDIESSLNEDVVPTLPKGALRVPKEPRQWNVGWRIGPELKKALDEMEKVKRVDGLSQGTHASPRPHIRISHFRNCRVGPGRLGRRIVWIPAVPVNFKYGAPTSVIRHVMDSKAEKRNTRVATATTERKLPLSCQA